MHTFSVWQFSASIFTESYRSFWISSWGQVIQEPISIIFPSMLEIIEEYIPEGF
jgi:hypothetical protein